MTSLSTKWLTRPLLRLISLWIRPAVLPENPAALLSASSAVPVLYLFETHSLADRAALQVVCRQHHLPDPDSAFEFGSLKYTLSVDVLKQRRRRLLGRAAFVPSDKPGALLRQMSVTADLDCLVVPVSVYWGQEPQRDDSFWRVFLSENWELTSRFRKLLMTLAYGRHTLLRFSEPVLLSEFVKQADDAGRGAGTSASKSDSKSQDGQQSVARIERKLQRTLRVHFRRRRRATLGPDLSHRRMLIEHVLADQDVRAELGRQLVSTEPDQSLAASRLQAQAKKYAEEIAANMSHRTVRLLHRLFTRLWTQLYDGIELGGMHRLDNIVEGREIIYVPCHRSHVDYLLLSYILYINGYSLPHIAAGRNLDLPIVGGVLRRGGAFFLRRTFSGNKLYATVFNTYLKELVQRGHSLEYFIEGGRSRSGLLLPAKPGMLSMTVQAYLNEPVRPIVFVPVYFGYERLLEGRSYSRELSGGGKKKESLLGFIKALKTLRENYGRVYVNFGEPVVLADLLYQKLPGWKLQGGSPDLMPDSAAHANVLGEVSAAIMAKAEVESGPKPTTTVDDKTAGNTGSHIERLESLLKTPAYRDTIDQLGRQVLININKAASVTPVSLIATLLLATPGLAADRDELEQQLSCCHRLLTLLNHDSQVVLPVLESDKWLQHTHSLGFLDFENTELGNVVRVRHRQEAALHYFRNNVLHLFVFPSLIACLFNQQRSVSKLRLQRLLTQAWPVLSAEFFLGHDVASDYASTVINNMNRAGLLDIDGDRVLRPSSRSLESVLLTRMATLLTPTIERSYLASALLAQCKNGLVRSEFEQRFRVAAQRFAMIEARDENELYSKAAFKTLVESLLATAGVEEHNGVLKANRVLRSLELEIRQILPDATRYAMLAAARLAATGGNS